MRVVERPKVLGLGRIRGAHLAGFDGEISLPKATSSN
jgi:hypothetical protein